MLSNLSERLHLDRSLALVLATKVWQVMSGPVTIALIIATFSLQEQGVYSGIIGIVGIQSLFELGLLNVLIGQAGHEMPHLRKGQEKGNEDEQGTPDEPVRRMAELVRGSRRWFAVASLLFAALALVFGWVTFHGGAADGWQMPLMFVVPLSAIAVFLSPSVAILEGAGFRADVYRTRLFQMVTGSLVVWGGLVLGCKLWVLVFSAAAQAGWMAYLTHWRHASFFQQFLAVDQRPQDFSWRRDVVPIQWRSAIVSIVFYVATGLFTVIVINFHSATEAAPLGMTLTIVAAIQMLALAWIQTKYPVVAALHGEMRREEAGTLWRQIAITSTALLVAGLGALIALIAMLPVLETWIQVALVPRFLSVTQAAMLGAGCVLNHAIAIQSFYVLSRRSSPLLNASVIGYGSVAIAVWFGGYWDGTNGLLIGYMTAMLLVAFPVHTLAYMKFRSAVRDPISV
ncbi:hypothetical protein K227x_15350 [Rubripirellula lacrimiformis]|uniref:Polysaccharide biosynthesis protein n=1 Tax=Rubripirellula lacrimiformis TaxID=1930273 RepID=A0A517N7N9_9BACT|nr:hypothetical protein [Rubripirellula lacrimiformis]QDT03153.1 hypothetical protein K227x_15350 [Rubripirellula lacrimiformis]